MHRQCLSEPSTALTQHAMRIVQVSQTEQASIQAAFSLVRTLSGMYAPLYFTNHYFNTSWTSEPHLLTRPALSSCRLGVRAYVRVVPI